MPPYTRRTPPNQAAALASRRSQVEDKLATVADKAKFKPRKETSLSLQFNKLSMSELTHESGKITINGVPSQPIGSKLLSNLIEEQTRYLPVPDYMKKVQKDTDVEEFMRHELMTWLLQLNKHFEYHSETFSVACNLFDRMLSSYKVKARLLQLIAATSLLIAAKMQEAWNTHPSLKELALAGNNYFKCSDIERMEKLMLKTLEWNVNPVTPHVLVHQIVPHLALPEFVPAKDLVEMVEDILDASHLEYRFLHYKPSTLAAAAILSALTKWGGVDREAVAGRLLMLTHSKAEMVVKCMDEMRLVNLDCAPML